MNQIEELNKKNKELEEENKFLKDNMHVQIRNAEERIQSQLTYRLGEVIVKNTKTPFAYLTLPFRLYIAYNNWKADKNNEVVLSVIIPVFNGSKYLKECFESIYYQGKIKKEFIFVDDGSKDDSCKIIQELIRGKDNCYLIRQNNQHAGVARNNGLKMAKGQYVHFLDCDDWMENDAYAKLINSIENHKADVIVFNYFNYDNLTKKKTEANYLKNISNKYKNKTMTGASLRSILFKAAVVPWNKIYKREFLLKNNLLFDDLIVANDRAFYFKLLKSNPKIVISDIPYINYRVSNKNSLIGKERIRNFDCHFKSFNETRDFFLYDQEYQIFLDQFITDLRIFFEKADDESKKEVKKQIKDYFIRNSKYFNKIDQLKGKRSFEFYNMICGRRGIPVVFAVDDDYVKYLSVAILSLKKKASKSYKYDIFVFYSDLNENNKSEIKKLEEDNFVISFYDVKPLAKDLNLYSRAHYSISMYYRIFIPKILYQYDKAIYLDADLLIKGDISKLFFDNLGDYWLSASPNLLNNDMRKYTKWKMNLDFPKYFNSGVLVFNIRKWNDKRLVYKCIDLIEENRKLVCPDQDVLNISCKDRVKYLGIEWNFAWQHIVLCSELSSDQRNLIDSIDYDKIEIIHYTSGVKPWKLRNWKNIYGKTWWEFAKESPFFNSIVSDLKTFEKKNNFTLSERA